MPPAPSCARNRYSPITRGSSAASGFISSPRVRSRASHSALYLAKRAWPMSRNVSAPRLLPGGIPARGIPASAGLRRQLAERDVQLEHVDRWLTEEAERPALGVRGHRRLDLGHRQ